MKVVLGVKCVSLPTREFGRMKWIRGEDHYSVRGFRNLFYGAGNAIDARFQRGK